MQKKCANGREQLSIKMQHRYFELLEKVAYSDDAKRGLKFLIDLFSKRSRILGLGLSPNSAESSGDTLPNSKTRSGRFERRGTFKL